MKKFQLPIEKISAIKRDIQSYHVFHQNGIHFDKLEKKMEVL